MGKVCSGRFLIFKMKPKRLQSLKDVYRRYRFQYKLIWVAYADSKPTASGLYFGQYVLLFVTSLCYYRQQLLTFNVLFIRIIILTRD